MEYHGSPVRVVVPYDWFAEYVLTRVTLLRHGVPRRVLDAKLGLGRWLRRWT